MIVQGLPLRQEIAPGDCTVHVTRRNELILPPCIWGVERRAEFSPLGSLAGYFLALGSDLGLVGTASSRR